MNAFQTLPADQRPQSNPSPQALLAQLSQLRQQVVAKAGAIRQGWQLPAGTIPPSLDNLAHKVALRADDLRPLQRQLMVLGLSSLGRLESRVMPTLDAVIAALSALAGIGPVDATPMPARAERFFAGEMALAETVDALFGPPPLHRRGRIMVTIPGDATETLLLDLAQRGMDVARINCAHDGPERWRMLAGALVRVGEQVGRRIPILMDIAGPKIRTEAVEHADGAKKLQVGDAFRLVASGSPRLSDGIRFSASVSLPEIVTHLAVGDRMRYDDGKLEGYVEAIGDEEAIIRVSQAKAGGAKIKPEKGINLPDTDLGLSPLTAKDETDLVTVLGLADMIG
jgi:pyruvate kinase